MAKAKNSITGEAVTPMFQRYKDLKEKHPEALLLFRLGDFYECYDEDAKNASKALGITLTKRNDTLGSDGKIMCLAGFPHHALDTYIPKLIRAGYRVAICDPTDEKKSAKGTAGIEEFNPTEEEPETDNVDTLKCKVEELNREIASLKEEKKANNDAILRDIIRESIKALRGELPVSLATYFYNAIGKLEVIKIKNSQSWRLTTDEISFLIDQAEQNQK